MRFCKMNKAIPNSKSFSYTRKAILQISTGSMLPVFSGVRDAHLLLFLCMYGFSYFVFFVIDVCFPCLVFVPGLHQFDYRYNLGSLDYSFYLKESIVLIIRRLC